MSIQRAEQLKRELTDKFVVVADGVPELRRFAGLTGRVKTVNMSSRALVQFDGPADIGWYDIDPSYLVVVDAPYVATINLLPGFYEHDWSFDTSVSVRLLNDTRPSGARRR